MGDTNHAILGVLFAERRAFAALDVEARRGHASIMWARFYAEVDQAFLSMFPAERGILAALEVEARRRHTGIM